jgi:hypothetical protein
MKRLALAAPALAWVGRGLAADAPRVLPEFDLGFLDREMDLVRRGHWTGVAPKPWRLLLAKPFKRITLHHAGNQPNYHTVKNAVIHDLDGILTAHCERNYGDIGYHFVVDYGGRVWEGRSLLYEGAHVSHQNEGNVGIMLQGNFEVQKPSEIQAFAARRLVQLLRARFAIARECVYGHRDLGASICPGRNLYQHVVAIRGTG